MKPRLHPWTREFSKEFDKRASAWVLVGIGLFAGLLFLFVFVRDSAVDALYVSLFCFLWATYWAYPAVSLLIARRIGVNRAVLIDGKLVIGRRRWWDLAVWGMTLMWFLWLVVIALWYANTYGPFVDGNEVRYGRSVVLLYVAPIGVVLSTLMFSTYKVHKQFVVVDSIGVTHLMGKHALVQLSWSEITGISIFTDGPNEAFRFEVARNPVQQKNWMGLEVGGRTLLASAGFDVEPNALIRTMRALVDDPEVREWIGTPKGLQFLLDGPAWKDIDAIPVGAQWVDGKVLEESA